MPPVAPAGGTAGARLIAFRMNSRANQGTRSAKKKRWQGFGYERNPRKQSSPTSTEHPSTMPASECCPGSPGAWFRESFSPQHAPSFSVGDAAGPAMSRAVVTESRAVGKRGIELSGRTWMTSAHVGRLSHVLDNACPPENCSFGFSSCPGNRHVPITASETGTKTGTKGVRTSRN